MPQQANDFVQRVVDGFDHLREALNAAAEQRGQEVLDAHRCVRAAARMTRVRYAVEPQLPPDVLGIYVLLPIPGRQAITFRAGPAIDANMARWGDDKIEDQAGCSRMVPWASESAAYASAA